MKTILYYISYHIASTLVHGHCVDKENHMIHKLCVSFRANPYLGGSHIHGHTDFFLKNVYEKTLKIKSRVIPNFGSYDKN